MEGSRFSILILSFTTSEAEIAASASSGLGITFAVASPCRRRLNELFHPQAALEAATHRGGGAQQYWEYCAIAEIVTPSVHSTEGSVLDMRYLPQAGLWAKYWIAYPGTTTFEGRQVWSDKEGIAASASGGLVMTFGVASPCRRPRMRIAGAGG